MKILTYEACSIDEAMKLIKSDFGDEAVIIETKEISKEDVSDHPTLYAVVFGVPDDPFKSSVNKTTAIEDKKEIEDKVFEEKYLKDDYVLFLGQNILTFIQVRQKYALKKIKEMRERVSKKTGITVEPIRIKDKHSLAPNIAELNWRGIHAIKGFEYNDFSKKTFKKFLKKLEKSLEENIKVSDVFEDKESDELIKEIEEMRKKITTLLEEPNKESK